MSDLFKSGSPYAWFLRLVALGTAIFHLYVATFGPPNPFTLRGLHVGLALFLLFLTVRVRGTRSLETPWYDAILAIAAFAAAIYPAIYSDYIYSRFIYVEDIHTADWIFGAILIVLILEGTRRLLGPVLPLTALAFLTYGFVFAKTEPTVVMEQLFLTTEGIFGIPVAVSATYMVLFIIFGAFVERMGVGQLFMDFAVALTGRSIGGPAKVACVTSSLFGTVSGSAVANVMTTGTFSIPLMKKTGFRPAFAGAVEAVASTGGQIMPPIMGAAAFVMAEYLSIPYLKVAAYALVPSVLFYWAVFAAVHFEAKRSGMTGLPKEECPSLWEVLKERGHLFLPLGVIIGVLLSGYSAAYAALLGIISVVPTALLRKTTRSVVTLSAIVEALEAAVQNVLPIAAAVASAGIVVGVIDIVGLGLEFSNFVIGAARETLVIALILTMIAGIILGMGMPTTPAYIVQVALLVPALVKLGVEPVAAHMFVLYFAVLSAITPPVAMAVYAAVSLARSSIIETSLAAVRLGATAYIVPFLFVYDPALLGQGETWWVALAFATAVAGVTCLAAALHGYLFGALPMLSRALLLAAAFLMVVPGPVTDSAGVAAALLAMVARALSPPPVQRATDG
ncbi:MAG: TRAP transporter permease [Methyloligellaceae bacterium]